jgi:nicotinate-nucleotide adenylyltransferase
MLQLAVASQDRIFVDDCELKREGTSYTVDTLFGYRQKVGGSEPLLFLMGRDSWLTLASWHRWEELTDLAHLLILERPGPGKGYSRLLRKWRKSRQVSDPKEMMNSPSGKVCLLSLDQINVSASSLRHRIAEGSSMEEDVNSLVMSYITQHNLYKGTSSKNKMPGRRMEH